MMSKEDKGMKPEPLTKEKIKVIPKELIEKIIESENLITIVFKDKVFFKDRFIKQRVKSLLDNINEFYAYKDLNKRQAEIVKKAIKKAFEGVIEE